MRSSFSIKRQMLHFQRLNRMCLKKNGSSWLTLGTWRMKSNSIIYSNFNSTTFLPNWKWIIFIYSQASAFLFGPLWCDSQQWLLMVLCYLRTRPSLLPVVREKVSLMVATMHIFYPITSGFNSSFLHFNLKKFQAKLPKPAIFFLCLQTHPFIHLFNKLDAYCLPGTVLGARNRMESKTRHHSCLPEAFNLSGRCDQVITDIILNEMR